MGDWEHSWGVKIVTLDNPGWDVEIDLNGTRYAEVQNRDLATEKNGDMDWMICRIRDGKFQGFGDPHKLGKIIQVFRKWIDEY
jgi:hypothetical protein